MDPQNKSVHLDVKWMSNEIFEPGGDTSTPGRGPWVPSRKFRVFISGIHSLPIFNP